MKKTKNLIICLLTALMLVSCKVKNSDDNLSFFDPLALFDSNTERLNISRTEYDYNNISDDYGFTVYDLSDKVKRIDDVAVSDKYIYVADNNAFAIHIYDKELNFIKDITTYDNNRENLIPQALCLDKDGNLYVINQMLMGGDYPVTIVVLDIEGEYIRHITVKLKDNLPMNKMSFLIIKDIVVLDNDDIYFCFDSAPSIEHAKIIKTDQSGKVLSVIGNNSLGVLSKTSTKDEVAFTNSMYKTGTNNKTTGSGGQPALYRFNGTTVTMIEKIAPDTIIKLKIPEESKATEELLAPTITGAMTFYNNEYYLLNQNSPGFFIVFDEDFKYVRTQKIIYDNGWDTYLSAPSGAAVRSIQNQLNFISIGFSNEYIYIGANSSQNSYMMVGKKYD